MALGRTMTDDRDVELGRALMKQMYGGWDHLEGEIKKGAFNYMNKSLLAVFGLVAFKLVTQEIAKKATALIEDKSDRIYRARLIKERIRQSVIDEWRREGPAEALQRTKSYVREQFPVGAISDEDVERITADAEKQIDTWVRQALDFTPTADELLEAVEAVSDATERSKLEEEEMPDGNDLRGGDRDPSPEG